MVLQNGGLRHAKDLRELLLRDARSRARFAQRHRSKILDGKAWRP